MLPVCVGVDSVISNPCNMINPEGSEEEKVGFFFFCFEYLITFFFHIIHTNLFKVKKLFR